MAIDMRLGSLGRLVGFWNKTVTIFDNVKGDQTFKVIDAYYWSANGKFLHHDVDGAFGEMHLQSFEVISLCPSGSGYTSRLFRPDGRFTDFSIESLDDAWRFEATADRFSGQISKDGLKLLGQWDRRSDNGWVPYSRICLEKRLAA